MMNLIKKKSVLFSASFVFASLAFSSCSSSSTEEDPQPANGNNFKITVTLNNVSATNDYVSVVTVGGTSSGVYTNWKVNGKVRTGENSISLGKTDFTGSTKTYVIETSEPIKSLTAGTQIINYGDDMPMSYKIEKNGKVVIDENLTLKGDNSDFTKNYSF